MDIYLYVYRLETARVGFTCGPRVSKTGAAGAFTNMINMSNKHDNSNAATSNDYAPSSNKSDMVMENEAQNHRLSKNTEDLEIEGEAKKS